MLLRVYALAAILFFVGLSVATTCGGQRITNPTYKFSFTVPAGFQAHSPAELGVPNVLYHYRKPLPGIDSFLVFIVNFAKGEVPEGPLPQDILVPAVRRLRNAPFQSKAMDRDVHGIVAWQTVNGLQVVGKSITLPVGDYAIELSVTGLVEYESQIDAAIHAAVGSFEGELSYAGGVNIPKLFKGLFKFGLFVVIIPVVVLLIRRSRRKKAQPAVYSPTPMMHGAPRPPTGSPYNHGGPLPPPVPPVPRPSHPVPPPQRPAAPPPPQRPGQGRGGTGAIEKAPWE